MPAAPQRSEVVIAFVGPVGVEDGRFRGAVTTRLKAFGYQPELVRLSTCLDELKAEGLLKTALVHTPEFDRIWSHMDAGDELRGLQIEDAAGHLARAAIAKIADKRSRSGDTTQPLAGRAWIISSLKNPAEVEIFRSVYGPGFFLVGLFATESTRKAALVTRGMSKDEAGRLIKRDYASGGDHGQQTRKTFELADAWVQTESQLRRVLDLIFGCAFETPTDDEDGMATAYTAALRSSSLSRQVGAAVVSHYGEVLATGCNEVPAPGGGQYSPPTEERRSARDIEVGEDSNTKELHGLQSEIAGQIESALTEALPETPGELRKLIDGILAESRIREITEYGRAVHAEMAALLAGVRAGISMRGATLYCTTFPCHNCAKHIVAAGIARVVFVEPYPKSKAMKLHADAITLVGEDTDDKKLSALTEVLHFQRTRFEPFLGVGARRYFDLFSLELGAGRQLERKSDDGDLLSFDVPRATPRVELKAMQYLELELEAVGTLNDSKLAMKEGQ